MSFKDYYINEKMSHLRLRESVCERLSISKETFYIRLRSNNWSNLEKEAISDLLEIEMSELFPDPALV